MTELPHPARQRQARTPICFVGLALLLSAACDDKREHCNTLIDAINPHTTVLNGAVEKLATVQSDPAVIDGLRAAAEDADQSLKTLQLEDPKLSGFALSYRKQLQSAKNLADELAAAAGDAAKLHGAVNSADAFLARQDEILGDLNAYCGGT